MTSKARFRCCPIFLAFAFLLASAALGATPRTLVAKVERVSDGDTLIAITVKRDVGTFVTLSCGT